MNMAPKEQRRPMSDSLRPQQARSKLERLRFAGWAAMLCTLLVSAFVVALRAPPAVLFGLSKGRPGLTTHKFAQQCIVQPRKRYDGGGQFGFVFSATDRYAAGMAYRCVAAIESLVKIGGWSGPIYMMVGPKGRDCLDQAHLRKVTGSDNVHVVHEFYSVLRGMPTVYSELPRHFFPGSAKSVKGAMIDIVGLLHGEGINGTKASGPPPEVLIFHDCDKVVARTGCIEEMVRVPLPFGPEKRFYVSHMEPKCIRAKNGTGPCGNNLHAGVVAVHREWSLPIARAWALEQLRHGKRYDRHTLWEAWNNSRSPDGKTEWKMASLPPVYQDSMWNVELPPSCINHVSGGRCKDAGQKRARTFMRSLCLGARPHDKCPHDGSTEDWCGWDSPSRR